MSEAQLLSVVIPAWNEEAYIGETLRAVFEAVARLESAGGRAEVIVVDNGSTDATVERTRAFPVRVVNEPRRRIATVRNAGALAARGEYLAFVDADSRPSANSLERIWRVLSTGRFTGGGTRICPERRSLRLAPLYLIPAMMRVVLGVSGGMIFATREDFDAVGRFDEGLYAAEDFELVLALRRRAHKTGKKFANLSDVRIVTSVRKADKASWREWLIFPKYLFNRDSARRFENCRLWYAGHR